MFWQKQSLHLLFVADSGVVKAPICSIRYKPRPCQCAVAFYRTLSAEQVEQLALHSLADG